MNSPKDRFTEERINIDGTIYSLFIIRNGLDLTLSFCPDLSLSSHPHTETVMSLKKIPYSDSYQLSISLLPEKK